ncbi:MAG: hypothetical protein IJS94_01125 [Clostridia bacterium]|nr:hypothetical protein [Clostridia bacterium]
MKFHWACYGEPGKSFGEGKVAAINTNTSSAFKNKFTIVSIGLVLIGLVGAVASSHYSGSKDVMNAQESAMYECGIIDHAENWKGKRLFSMKSHNGKL